MIVLKNIALVIFFAFILSITTIDAKPIEAMNLDQGQDGLKMFALPSDAWIMMNITVTDQNNTIVASREFHKVIIGGGWINLNIPDNTTVTVIVVDRHLERETKVMENTKYPVV